MVDSYILHIIARIDFKRSMSELNKRIEAELNENYVMRQKSLYYAAKSYV